MAKEKKPRKPRAKKREAKSETTAGRPTKYVRAVADRILFLHENGERIRASCEINGVPLGTFLGWVHDDRDDISDRYARAQRCYAEVLLDECLEIIDDARNDYVEKKRNDGSTFVAFDSEHVRRSEMRVGHRRWIIDYVRQGGILQRKKDDAGDGVTPAADAIAALERLAAGKAAQAEMAPAAA